MTFYNIIFGILFLASTREIVLALASQSPAQSIWEPVTLAILIFSDVIYTSHTMEELRRPYTVWMKLIDLAIFCVLTTALLSINPSNGNFLQVDASNVLPALTTHGCFWGLIATYWIMLMVWCWVGGIWSSPSIAQPSNTPRRMDKCFGAVVKHGRVACLIVYAFAAVYLSVYPLAVTWVGPLAFMTAFVAMVLTAAVIDKHVKFNAPVGATDTGMAGRA